MGYSALETALLCQLSINVLLLGKQ
ncbi:hypothetical protein CY0110_17617 [Crocosphaera chwakensis CCY0110]|uniref:Uncharacterized protein n=1 Tax=Crocosphaera chwakensis CCY0110 TaxID=391612 RepID=A3IIK5_9CHRO|nr:hypothetical protein CY0110_17617 [Crocosphaera chwakensis CCY0110]